jgi:biotin transport system substrate-specific component
MKENSIIKNTLFILLGAFLMSISGQLPLQLPLISTDIPGTWQTFVVLVFAFSTSQLVGTLAVFVYLVAGALGLPVFADSSSGVDVILGNTGGYLYGFLVGAGFVGWFGERYSRNHFMKNLLAMTIGTLIILVIGVSHLGLQIGFENALKYGFYSFLLGAGIKIILGAAVLPLYFFIKNTRRN